MEQVLDFLADNYLWFLIGALVLLFAIIGFLVEGRRKKKKEAAEGMAQSEMPPMPAGVDPTLAQAMPVDSNMNGVVDPTAQMGVNPDMALGNQNPVGQEVVNNDLGAVPTLDSLNQEVMPVEQTPTVEASIEPAVVIGEPSMNSEEVVIGVEAPDASIETNVMPEIQTPLVEPTVTMEGPVAQPEVTIETPVMETPSLQPEVTIETPVMETPTPQPEVTIETPVAVQTPDVIEPVIEVDNTNNIQ